MPNREALVEIVSMVATITIAALGVLVIGAVAIGVFRALSTLWVIVS